MQPWFTAYILDIGHSCYAQQTPVKSRYPLISITCPIAGLGVAHVLLLSWPLTTYWVSIRSRGQAELTCCNQGRVVWKLTQGQKLAAVYFFLVCTPYVLCSLKLSKRKTERRPHNMNRKLHRKVTKIQNFLFSWVSLIRLWTTRSRSSVFSLG